MNEVRIAAGDYAVLRRHLFQPDLDEHGALLLAGQHFLQDGRLLLTVREVHTLDSEEFPPGVQGYRQLSARALARIGNRAADEKLTLITAHSHPGASDRTSLSPDDLAAHQRVFPHLLDITDANAVCGIAFGQASAAGEVWLGDGSRQPLDCVRIVGANTDFLRAQPATMSAVADARFDRQVRLFGAAGQARLRKMHVGIIGAGGGGSLLTEYLAHLGVGQMTIVDYDIVKSHNLSRIAGATERDAEKRRKKIAVAARLVKSIDSSIKVNAIDGDIADRGVATRLTECDYLFLATDTATARLVGNAIAQSFLIPLVQIGAKVESQPTGDIEQIYTAVRPVLPRRGCLWCAGLINPDQLQREAATKEERQNQNYLNEPDVIDPSVITLNAAAAAGAANAFLMGAVGLADDELGDHRITLTREGTTFVTRTSENSDCRWCGSEGQSRYGRASVDLLPCRPSGVSDISTVTRRRQFTARLRRQKT